MLRSVLLLVAIISVVGAQQTNGPAASMRWNNQDGPSWPITNVSLPGGLTAQIDLNGASFAPFALATAASLQSPGIPVLGNSLLDLDPFTSVIIWDPTLNPAFSLDPTGSFTLTGVAPTLPAGIRVPYQAAIYDPAAPQLVTLTAATEIVTATGVISLPHSLGGDNNVQVNLNPYGFQLPFYGVNRSSYYVNANGFISFTMGTTDFTSNPAELTSQMPRICLMWTDLDPGTSPGGSVVSQIDLSGAIPQVRVDYNGIFSFGTGQPVHNMAWVHNAGPDGSLQIIQQPNQQASNFTMMCGISAGSAGLSNITGVDLTMIQDTGGQSFPTGRAIFEWFGFQGQTYYSGPTNFWDLTNRTFTFFPNSFGSGIAGSQGYFLF